MNPEETNLYRQARLLFTLDEQLEKQGSADLGITRRELADKLYRQTIQDGLPQFGSGVSDTPEGRLSAARWLLGWLIAGKHFGASAIASVPARVGPRLV